MAEHPVQSSTLLIEADHELLEAIERHGLQAVNRPDPNLNPLQRLTITLLRTTEVNQLTTVSLLSAIQSRLATLRGVAASGSERAVENVRIEEMRSELNQLLRKQVEVLESRSLGTATEAELVEYEMRQEAVHQLCNELAHSISV